MSTKSRHLLHLTTSFINSFIANTPPTKILDTYFTPTASITEHGPLWARERLPFLATTFSGRGPQTEHDPQKDQSAPPTDTLDDYYTLLSQTLRFLPRSNTLPLPEEYVVDEQNNKVVVKLKGKFESLRTGKGWEEEFVYVMGVRETGVEDTGKDGIGRWRIETLELWADPLSAWVACGE